MNSKDKLLQAIALLDEVRSTLDTKAVECPCCGLNKKENWSEAQLAESLRSAAGKIRKCVDLLPRPPV